MNPYVETDAYWAFTSTGPPVYWGRGWYEWYLYARYLRGTYRYDVRNLRIIP